MIRVWIVPQDLYHTGLHWVFGLAQPGRGAIVSTYRLDRSIPLFLVKELAHELGHCFGLEHCQLPCVMTYSWTVEDAHQKSNLYCPRCRAKMWTTMLAMTRMLMPKPMTMPSMTMPSMMTTTSMQRRGLRWS